MIESGHLITTFAGALFFGILFIIISNKLKVPSIVVLLIGGIAVGPIGFNIVDPSSLGIGLKTVIQLSVALILFEGGLTLNIKEYREVSSDIKAVLSIGVLITWFLSAASVKFLFNFSWSFAILSGSLIIVTGPTVIGPLLKRIMVKKNIHGFLHWEGILIDPIGVFIALLCFEWIIGQNALPLFLLRIFIGISAGLLFGFILSYIIKKKFLSDELLNIFILSSALGIYAVTDFFVPESGLMSVVIAGFYIGYADTPQIDSIRVYKAQLIELLIGLLFILLSANLDIRSFGEHYGINMIAVVAIVMVIIRPLNIFVSTIGKKHFNFREKLFLSWVAPRGIVAASMASLFALTLRGQGKHSYNADFLEAFTYAVISGTVIIQGFSAKMLGRLLKVLEPVPTGWLIIGSHNSARIIGKYIQDKGFDVVLIDTNMHSVKVAKREGLTSISENAMTVDVEDYPELYGIGNVLAITKNENLNEFVCQRFKKILNKPNLYRWQSSTSDGDDKIGKEPSDGTPVWTSIPIDKMSFITNDEETAIKEINIPSEKLRHPEYAFLYSDGSIILPYIPEECAEKYSILMYQPFNIELGFNINQDLIVYSDSSSISSVLMELLQCLNAQYPDIDIYKIHKQLMIHEKEYPSAIGYNVSLPHAYIDDITESVVLMAKFKEAISGGFDGEDIIFVFLVLSPVGQPNTHIDTLSKISKFIVNDNNRNLLFNASSQYDLIRVFFPGKYPF